MFNNIHRNEIGSFINYFWELVAWWYLIQQMNKYICAFFFNQHILSKALKLLKVMALNPVSFFLFQKNVPYFSGVNKIAENKYWTLYLKYNFFGISENVILWNILDLLKNIQAFKDNFTDRLFFTAILVHSTLLHAFFQLSENPPLFD